MSIAQAWELKGKQIKSGQDQVKVSKCVLDASSLGHSIEAYSSNCTSKSCLQIYKRKKMGLSRKNMQNEKDQPQRAKAQRTPNDIMSKLEEWK